jgi:hypothetical protein
MIITIEEIMLIILALIITIIIQETLGIKT